MINFILIYTEVKDKTVPDYSFIDQVAGNPVQFYGLSSFDESFIQFFVTVDILNLASNFHFFSAWIFSNRSSLINMNYCFNSFVEIVDQFPIMSI